MILLMVKKERNSWVVPLFLSFLLVAFTARAQVNLAGKPGLINVPTATDIKEGTLSFGAVYNPANYALKFRGSFGERVFFGNLAILPRLNINVNILKPIYIHQDPIWDDLGDRQLDISYLLLKEKRLRPAVSIILSSPFTVDATMLTQVVVATKTLEFNKHWRSMITIGVGSPFFVYRDGSISTNYNVFSSFKWQKKSDYFYYNHYLVGLIGGIKLDYRDRAGVVLEYDSNWVNAGVYATLFKRWTLQAGLVNFDQWTFGTVYSFTLLKPSRRLKKMYEEER